MSSFTSLLFARPSFIEGLARLFDFGNTLQVYNVSHDGAEADQAALAADWHAIGGDMMAAVQEFTQANPMLGEDEQTQSEEEYS